jgi:hypothetical protein
MIDVYVYYKVQDAEAIAMQALVLELQADLSVRCGVPGQLKRRPESVNGQQTWMEVYQRAPGDFAATLELALQQTGLAARLAAKFPTSGPRHTEIFTDILSCA